MFICYFLVFSLFISCLLVFGGLYPVEAGRVEG
nr:MAG TPA_asm: hypothetical protein [Caudoviricetes sp.]